MGSATRHVQPVKSPSKQKYSIIIPAAGQGTRMKSYGVKSLIKVGEETILERQLRLISGVFSSYEVIVVTGFESARLVKKLPKNVKAIENKFYEKTNVCYSIALGLTEATTDNVLVVYGDLVFNKEALIAPYQKESIVTIDSGGMMKSDEVGCTLDKNTLCNMMYGLPNKWAQILYITGRELEIMRQEIVLGDCSKLLGFEIINDIVEQGGIFKAVKPKNILVTDIDTSKDIPTGKLICQSK